jgi:archaellum component FlaC
MICGKITPQCVMHASRSELKGFKKDENTNFQQMAEKYGDISNELKRFRENIEKTPQHIPERTTKEMR